MPGKRKFEHAHLRVPNLDETRRFYEDILGLEELSRDDGVVRLGPKPETHYDLIDHNFALTLEAGDGGLEHFAIRATEEELETAESRLSDEGVEYDVLEAAEPGQVRSLRFELPGGLPMELTVLEKRADPDRTDVPTPPTNQYAPKGQDHITLASPDVKTDTEFLRDVLGFNISDVAMAGPDTWGMSFTRWGDHHHDLAFIMEPSAQQTGLHHIAWQMTDVSHMKQFMDVLGKAGHEVEIDFTRHVLGNNVSVYFPDPADNRLEITAEVTNLDSDTPTTFHHEEPNDIVTFWDGTHPPIGGGDQ
jgi:catechol 2,3-dioxygenase